ncbi:MAG: hypothetical protein K1X70_10730 [Leptospirales bacterium]|nr:hypothetical protein [Leptospirales bacterium]HMW60047.1 hypothetical protein [Leptospiraceae bacterium]HNJ03149.1 hypothetical protein [Leptospiraceae bacterium]HNN58637.1 hypothetical protein [Leptospiraceae bacterium]HNN76033.1 hypothetical protein [Leptospiraceae bacterium]
MKDIEEQARALYAELQELNKSNPLENADRRVLDAVFKMAIADLVQIKRMLYPVSYATRRRLIQG